MRGTTRNTGFRPNEPVSHISNEVVRESEKKTEKNIGHFKVLHCGEF